jgi:hypothetical protein
MKYEYSTSEQMNTDGRPTKRPIVEITIERDRQRRTFLALIDSGADQIIMPSAIAVVFVDANVPVLLGRERFFDYYRVKFDQARGIFELTDLR